MPPAVAGRGTSGRADGPALTADGDGVLRGAVASCERLRTWLDAVAGRHASRAVDDRPSRLGARSPTQRSAGRSGGLIGTAESALVSDRRDGRRWSMPVRRRVAPRRDLVPRRDRAVERGASSPLTSSANGRATVAVARWTGASAARRQVRLGHLGGVRVDVHGAWGPARGSRSSRRPRTTTCGRGRDVAGVVGLGGGDPVEVAVVRVREVDRRDPRAAVVVDGPEHQEPVAVEHAVARCVEFVHALDWPTPRLIGKPARDVPVAGRYDRSSVQPSSPRSQGAFVSDIKVVLVHAGEREEQAVTTGTKAWELFADDAERDRGPGRRRAARTSPTSSPTATRSRASRSTAPTATTSCGTRPRT